MQVAAESPAILEAMLARLRLWALVGLGVVLGSLGACADDDGSLGAGAAGAAGATGGGGAAAGAGGAGGDLPVQGPHLVLPGAIDLPYVLALSGGSSIDVDIPNDGDEDAVGLVWSLTGSPLLTLASAPDVVVAGGQASLTIDFAGADAETIEQAALSVDYAGGPAGARVFAVAGDPALGGGVWEPVESPGGVPCGEGLTVALPTAPYPYGGSPFTDASVRLFVPEGHRDVGVEDVVIHFHGHSTTLAGTLADHLYENHLCASGVNALLVVPQGPYLTASGDFGKLMDPGGVEALVRQALVVLYREGRVQSPALGELVLTSHSGGYWAVASNLDPAVNALPVAQIDLFDSVYGFESSFEAFAEAGGVLRSNYTSGGGTLDNNQAMVADLEGAGVSVATDPDHPALVSADPLIYFADTSHSGATRLDGAYGEQLRWRLHHHRRGPRIELRQAVASDGTAELRWLAPDDAETTGYRIERSDDGAHWDTVAETSPGETSVTLPWLGGGRVRVVPMVPGLAAADTASSNVYRIDEDATVLVVDGFQRVIDGSWGGLWHDFAAVVGEAAGGAATVESAAVSEDGFDLGAFPFVIWLTGDESSADHSLSAADRDAIAAYLAGGGALIVSGSEIGYELGPTGAGADFLASAFGAVYEADDSGSYGVAGLGVAPFGYGGAGAPYPEDYPDAFVATGSGLVLLDYENGMHAAVGIAGRAAIVGFPLELIDDASARAEVVAALLAFVGG